MRGCDTKALSKEAPVSLVTSFVDLLQPLSAQMTAPTFDSFLTLLIGWVFARRRTVSGMILAADAAEGAKHHSAYHRVFSAARWSLDQLGLAVASVLLSACRGTMVLALDDTLCRKHGRKMYGVGMHHDPLISSRKMAVCNWGHSWVILGLVLELPCCPGRCWCLPVLFRLYRSKQTVEREGGSYRTRPELAVEMLTLLCASHPTRRFHVLADMAYGGQSVLKHLPVNCDLTSRLLLDARLVDDPPARQPGRRGRTALRGKPLPSPRKMLEQRATRLKRKTYGRDDCLRVVERQARLYHVPTRKVKVVATESLRGSRCLRAYYSTLADASSAAVLDAYATRFSIEQAIQDSKGHLGFEQPQNWSRRAVQRTAPVAMLLYTLIVWWFDRSGLRHWRPPTRPWYPAKRSPSFADMLATLRCQSVQTEITHRVGRGRGENKTAKTLLHLLRQVA
jgi:DDE superfamily endonuclease